MGLLATRWRLRTRSDQGNTAKRGSHSSGPWATLSRARRASSPTHTSPTRSSTPTATHAPHAPPADRATTDSSSDPSSHTPTAVGSTFNRSRAVASMHPSDAYQDLGHSNSRPSTRGKSRSTQNAPAGHIDGSTSVSSVSSDTPHGAHTARATHLPVAIRSKVATGASTVGSVASERATTASPFSDSPLQEVAHTGVVHLARLASPGTLPFISIHRC